ncbi:MAG: NAD(P)-dependent glycerol-3-phosphate dehydrogenase [Actinobacteria bacterium]|nr:MAG: NAD(P)-dependent glycerol-3-phosphate dehydrogenase [Actinomycetota bacterium]
MSDVAVVGAGSWGTAFASVLAANKVDTVLWGRRPETVEQINRARKNEAYLPGVELPPSLRATHHLEEALARAPVVVIGIPSHAFREKVVEIAPMLNGDAMLVSLTKGIERDTLMRMSEVAAEAAGVSDDRVAVLSGPNLAKEVAKGLPGASVVACRDEARAHALQRLFHAPTFRVYTNTDVCGVEIGGATKNVVAIAAGVADGLGYGENALAALVTRGLVEITRLGVRLGADPLTFAGLAGVGDLVATCLSKQSRNHHVGEELGKGRKLDDIIASMNMVAEGVKSCAGILAMAGRVSCDMPIASRVGKVLYEGADVKEMVDSLLTREAEPEFMGILGDG